MKSHCIFATLIAILTALTLVNSGCTFARFTEVGSRSESSKALGTVTLTVTPTITSVGQSITLSTVVSSFEGTIESYSYGSETLLLTCAATDSCTMTIPEGTTLGDHTITVTVTSSDDDQITASTTLTVESDAGPPITGDDDDDDDDDDVVIENVLPVISELSVLPEANVYLVGDTLTFSTVASDEEDGSVGSYSYSSDTLTLTCSTDSSTCEYIILEADDNANHLVTVTVTDSDGGEDSTSVTVIVGSFCSIACLTILDIL